MDRFSLELDDAIAPAKGRLYETAFFHGVRECTLTRDAYRRFLREVYHYVCHSTRLLALAAARCGPEHEPLFRRFTAHIPEESGHEQWALSDLQALGDDPAAVRAAPPLFPTSALVGYQYYLIEHLDPVAFLGYSYALEVLGAEQGPALARHLLVGLRLPDDALLFLRGHGDSDPHHVEEAREVLDAHVHAPASRAALIYNARYTYGTYAAMCDAVMAEWLSAGGR